MPVLVEDSDNNPNVIRPNETDKRFDPSTYLSVEGETIWLSFICVKEEFRRQGVLTTLVNDLKTKYKKIIIPEPFADMQLFGVKNGFKSDMLSSEEDGAFNVMVWEHG